MAHDFDDLPSADWQWRPEYRGSIYSFGDVNAIFRYRDARVRQDGDLRNKWRFLVYLMDHGPCSMHEIIKEGGLDLHFPIDQLRWNKLLRELRVKGLIDLQPATRSWTPESVCALSPGERGQSRITDKIMAELNWFREEWEDWDNTERESLMSLVWIFRKPLSVKVFEALVFLLPLGWTLRWCVKTWHYALAWEYRAWCAHMKKQHAVYVAKFKTITRGHGDPFADRDLMRRWMKVRGGSVNLEELTRFRYWPHGGYPRI